MAESQIIRTIKAKVEQLISQNNRLKEDVAKVSKQRDRLRDENRELAAQIATLEKRVNVLELREGISGDAADAKIAKARVNRLMREVDKCIALLNR